MLGDSFILKGREGESDGSGRPHFDELPVTIALKFKNISK